MLYMVIEDFRDQNIKSVYQRFEDRGRLMPDGLEYVNSWVTEDLDRCFQVMQTNDPDLLQQWIDNWSDLVDFEIIPVMTSAEAAVKVRSSAD